MKPSSRIAVLLMLAWLWPAADVLSAPRRFIERADGSEATDEADAAPSIARETDTADMKPETIAKVTPPPSAIPGQTAGPAEEQDAQLASQEDEAGSGAQTANPDPEPSDETAPAMTISEALTEAGKDPDGTKPDAGIGGELIEWVGKDRRIKRVRKVPATIYLESRKPSDKLIITDDHHPSATELLGISDVRQYGARPEESTWLYSGSKFVCELRHPIPGFGYAVMKQEVSEPLQFQIETDGLTGGSGQARIQSRPPLWKRFTNIKDLGAVTVEPKDKVLFSVSSPWVRQLMHELKEGMQPTISFWDDATGGDDVVLTVSSFNFQRHLPDFAKCLGNLLPYSFKDVRKRTVYFDYDNYKLSPAQRERLDRLIEYVKLDETVKKVDITGFTDSVGFTRYNKQLARRRAAEVKNYLLAGGVPADKVEVRAKGEKDKKFTNRTETGRKKNRRVEVTLIK